MTICVFGLWHLGCVTACCVAERFRTIGLDLDPAVVRNLLAGTPPIMEPGLDQLIKSGIAAGNLSFTNDTQAVQDAEIVWVTFDTPVNEDDEADYGYVETRIVSLFPYLRPASLVLISSQLPVGSTSRIESAYRAECPTGNVHFAYSPENLRLGKAIDAFRNPGRIVVGLRHIEDREKLSSLLTPFCPNLLWMSVESAEMTKHALNAFLANSIAFINEVATLCEEVGADAAQVAKGLKSDERIGGRAYLSAGGAFSGGTLARDISSLTLEAKRLGVAVPLLESIRTSNDHHKNWAREKLISILGTVSRKTISVLGLTYKPGTNTLRRSAAIELCLWLSAQRARVQAFDPAVKLLPEEFSSQITMCGSAIKALENADAVVVATEWAEFRELKAQDMLAHMRTPIVLDATRFLVGSLGTTRGLQYVAVGMPREDA
jgi:UDPglucose 6-dehydrogenase